MIRKRIAIVGVVLGLSFVAIVLRELTAPANMQTFNVNHKKVGDLSFE